MAAKSHPHLKISRESVLRAAEHLSKVILGVRRVEQEVAEQQSMALHEIRKLNRTIKQSAERLCRNESPSNPEQAPRELVAIWKAADLMSNQFDILEFLANEDLARLPCTALSEPYKVFDKLSRIYGHGRSGSSITLRAPPNYRPRAYLCDKTFPILVSVLLENAIKYSSQDSVVMVDISPSEVKHRCRIVVENICVDNDRLDNRIFEKGVRVSDDFDGTGKGLYVAKLIARQHNSDLRLEKDRVAGRIGEVLVRFRFDLAIVD